MYSTVTGFTKRCKCGNLLNNWQSKTLSVAGFDLFNDTANVNQAGIGTIFYSQCNNMDCQEWHEYEIKVVRVPKNRTIQAKLRKLD